MAVAGSLGIPVQNLRGTGMGCLFLIFLRWSVSSVDQGILPRCLELPCVIESSAMLEMSYFCVVHNGNH